MRWKRWIAGLWAVGVLSGCAEPGLDQLPADDSEIAVDELRTAELARYLGAWDGLEGDLRAIVFTETQLSPSTRRYFADQTVQCVRAPCPARRVEGAFRVTSRYLYVTINGVAKRYAASFSVDQLTLREGARVVYRFRRAVSYCARPADCAEQAITIPRCLGAMTCTSESRCVYVCGASSGSCRSNADCPSSAFCGVSAAAGATTTCAATGVCTPRPEACATVYQPVCGCDGRTHSNACVAASQGVRVARTGACR
jgi:hypothetical protein